MSRVPITVLALMIGTQLMDVAKIIVGTQKNACYRDTNRVEEMGTKEQSINQGSSSNESHLHFEAIYSNYWKSLMLCRLVAGAASTIE